MKTCNRLDFPEEETVYVLEADYAGLNKRYRSKKGKWEAENKPPPKNYKYEAYHVPDLKTYLELLRHLENDPTRCIINGKPKKTWKPGDTQQRKKEHITDKKTKYLMFDIDGMDLEGWTADTSPGDSYNMVQGALADVNPGFALQNVEVALQVTASWGKPGNTGPRMRVIYELDTVQTTQAILLFTKEFNKRYPHLHLDQAIYRPTQIVYTASPHIIPASAKPTLPGRGRAMKSKKTGKLNWDHISHGYDAGYEDIVKLSGPHATPEQDKQFDMLCDKLAENGLIREFDGVTEKAHIFCPWMDEHSSDTAVSATSMWRNSRTGHAAIKCQHASHEDKVTKDFIAAWVEEGIVTPQDFQDVTYEEAVNDFKDEEIPEEIETVGLAVIDRGRIADLSMKSLKDRFVYDTANDKYVDRLHGISYKKAVFDTLAPRVKNKNVDPGSKAPYNKVDLMATEAWNYEDPTVGEAQGVHVHDMTWIPKEELRDTIIVEKHLRYYNTFNGLPLRPVSGDGKLFIDHMRLVFPDDEGFEWAMGFIAHTIQRPWEKPSVALLSVSPKKGLGRGLLIELMNNLLGNLVITIPLNKLVDNKSDFNSFMDKKLMICVEEVKVPPRKREQANELLKTLITESRITVNKKYADEREGVPVYNRLFMMSNDLSAIKVDSDDRRVFIHTPPEGYEVGSADHYVKFAKAMKDPRFLAAVMDILMQWRIAVFKPFEKPPTTVAKRMMVKATAAAIESLALDAMERYGPDEFGISKDRFKDITVLNMHMQGLDHILQEPTTELEFKHLFATWEFKADRKRYMANTEATLYCKHDLAKRMHSATTKNDLGKQKVKNWDANIDSMLADLI